MSIGFDVPTDPVFELAPGWSRAFVIGRRFAVGAGVTADVWAGTATTRPLPIAPKAMSVRSAGADIFGVSGAQQVTVTFIDAAGDWRVSDLLPLNGATLVPITYKPTTPLVTRGGTASAVDSSSVAASIFRVQSASVRSSLGATEAAPKVTNVGIITVVDTATGLVVFDQIPIGLGRSHSAYFHAPRGYETKVHKMNTFTSRAGGDARAVFDVCVNFGIGTAFQRLGLSMLASGSALFTNDPAVTNIVPRSDFGVVMTPDNNSVDGLAVLEFRLKQLTS